MDASKRQYHRELGMRITEFRKRQGYTQAELAGFLGVSQNTVFSLELGDRRVSLDRVPTLMRVLEVSCEQLLGLAPPPSLPPRHVTPAELLLIEQVRALSVRDKRMVTRVALALSLTGKAGAP